MIDHLCDPQCPLAQPGIMPATSHLLPRYSWLRLVCEHGIYGVVCQALCVSQDSGGAVFTRKKVEDTKEEGQSLNSRAVFELKSIACLKLGIFFFSI